MNYIRRKQTCSSIIRGANIQTVITVTHTFLP